MIWITIRGSKGRVASVIEFRVQGDVLTSLTSVFNNKQGGKSQWTSAEEADLVPRMTRFFMEYFAEK